MNSFINLRNADDRPSGVAYDSYSEYTEVEKVLEDMKGQMDSVEDLRRKEGEREVDQMKKKEETTKWILANATDGKRKTKEDEEDSDDSGTPRGSKRRKSVGSPFGFYNGLESFSGSNDKSEASRLEFEHKFLDSQESMHHEMLEASGGACRAQRKGTATRVARDG